MKLFDSVPTDTLYKFMAIFGLVLFVLPFFFDEEVKKLQIEIIKKEAETEILSLDLKKLQNDLERLLLTQKTLNNKLVKEIFKNQKLDDIDKSKLNFSEEFKDEWKKLAEQQKQLLNENEKLSIQKKKEALQLKADGEILAFIDDDYNMKRFRYSILQIFGAIIGILGFVFWYFKNQRYIDIKLKREAEFNK